jgi:ribose transport system ATP-binding protein
MLPEYWKTKGIFAWPGNDVKIAKEYVKKLNVVTTSINKKVKELSGGNQQKVVLAKWFVTNGDIYIFDEPTRGIDIGAREEIYKVMTSLIKQGKCIMLISSDMPEIIVMSDRICVVKDGHIVTELNKDEMTEQTILKYSIGGGSF